MVSKWQKFNKYDNEIKEKVLNKYLNGLSSWYLERYKIIKNTKFPQGTYSYRRIVEGVKVEYKVVVMNGKKILRIKNNEKI